MKYLVIFLLFLLSTTVNAQIHIKKLKGVELNLGSSINRIYNIGIGGSYFINKKNYIKILFGYEKNTTEKYDSVSVAKLDVFSETYNIEASLYRSIYNTKRVYVNAGYGISTIYNNVRNIDYTENQNGVFVGGFIGLENELYLMNKFALICGIKQYYYINNNIVNIGKYRCLLNVGVKKTF